MEGITTYGNGGLLPGHLIMYETSKYHYMRPSKETGQHYMEYFYLKKYEIQFALNLN
jgi:hypothetical protein